MGYKDTISNRSRQNNFYLIWDILIMIGGFYYGSTTTRR